MLTIRLSRIGKKNKPMYRLTVSEKTKDPYGRALEILGSYNPHNKELKVKVDRIKHWLENGAGISATVNNLLIDKGIIKGEKMKASKSGKGKKAEEKQLATSPAPAESAQKTGKEKEKNPPIEEKETAKVEEKVETE